MPLIRSIEKLDDGLRIVRSNGAVVTVTSADIPGNIKSKPIADVQAWVNARLAASELNAACRINSLSPLDIDVAIGNAGFDMTDYVWGVVV